jgi:hypothetical protein
MLQKSRVTIGMITIYLILGLFYETTCRAQSKSERIRQMRSQSYAEDISKNETHISYLEQLQKDIGQVREQIETISPQAAFINQAQSTEAILSDLLTVLKNHNQTKRNISEHLVPLPRAPSGGYEGMSRSERVRLVRTDYCTDNKQNGEAIRQEIPALKAAMKKMLGVNPSDELLNEPIGQLQNQWSQIIPIVDDLYDEQMLAKELCTAIEQRVSKSERIRINRQGLKSGKPTPIFLNLITIN